LKSWSSEFQILRASGKLDQAHQILQDNISNLINEDYLAYGDACASIFAWDLIVALGDSTSRDARSYPLWIRYRYAQGRIRSVADLVIWPLDTLNEIDTIHPELRLIDCATDLNLTLGEERWAAASTAAATILELLETYSDQEYPFFSQIRSHSFLQIIPLAARHAVNPTTAALLREILSADILEPGVFEVATLYAWLFAPDESWDHRLQRAAAKADPFLHFVPSFLRCYLPNILALSSEDIQQIREIDEVLPGLRLPARFGLKRKYVSAPSIATSAGTTFSFTSISGASTISGNSHLIRLGSSLLLLDLGLNVNIPPAQAYQGIKANLLAALSDGKPDINRLHAILISHAHTDHIGLLPLLYRDSDLAMINTSAGSKPNIRIMANDPTRELAAVMLKDSANLHRRSAEPPFTEVDVTGVLRAIDPFPEDGQLDSFRDRGRIETWHAGHILGSQMLLLEHQDVRILFTGDINTVAQATVDPVLCPPGPIDVLIMEHTYGSESGHIQLSREEQESAFVQAVDRVLRRGGTIVVPAFAVGRAQEILCLLSEHAQNNADLFYEIYLDGLARSITAAYDYHIDETTLRYQAARKWLDRRLTVISTDDEREQFLESVQDRPSVIVASSGMLKTGSASHFYARSLAGDAANAIFLTGYMAEDSEAALIYSANKQDALDQLGIDVRCEVQHFHFTAHAPRLGLLNFVHELEPRTIILVHGDANRSQKDPASVYNILRNEGFDIHLGQESITATYRNGRLVIA